MSASTGQSRSDTNGNVYTLLLFVVEGGQNSERARVNLERLCEERLSGSFQIQVVDVVKDFQTALDFNILLTPALVIADPPPKITIHGDLSNPRRFIEALNLDEGRDRA